MKRFLGIIAPYIICAAISAQAQTSIKPGKTYHRDSITIVSPNRAGWTKLKTDKPETAFEKRTDADILAAGLKIVQTKTFETEKDWLQGMEALKNEEFSKFKKDHLDITFEKIKGVMCMHYDAYFPLDKTSSNKFAYFNVTGYLFQVAGSKDSAIQVEFSKYSETRGFTENERSLSEEFFEKLKLPASNKK